MSVKSKVTAIRLPIYQLKALDDLPSCISKSMLVRTLLREYLAGRLPQIHALVIQEATETQEAIKDGHRRLRQWQEQQQQKSNGSSGDSQNA